MTTTTKTAPPAAAVVATGGATKPGARQASPAAVALDEAGTALPAAASIPFARPRPGGMEALQSRSLVVATGTTATLSAVCRSGAAERAHTTVRAADRGERARTVTSDPVEGRGSGTEAGGSRLCPSASPSTETACGNASGAWAVSATRRWSCPACGRFHGYGQCRTPKAGVR